MCIHVPPPSWTSSRCPIPPPRPSQSIALGPMCYAAASHSLSVLRMAAHMRPSQSPSSPPLPGPHIWSEFFSQGSLVSGSCWPSVPYSPLYTLGIAFLVMLCLGPTLEPRSTGLLSVKILGKDCRLSSPTPSQGEAVTHLNGFLVRSQMQIISKDLRWFSAANAGHMASVPGLGRCPGGGNGNPLQYSCLGDVMDRGAWGATVLGVAKSWTWFSS